MLLFVCVEGVVGQGGLIRRTTQRMVARIVKSFAEGTWLLVGIQARGYALAQRLQWRREETGMPYTLVDGGAFRLRVVGVQGGGAMGTGW